MGRAGPREERAVKGTLDMLILKTLTVKHEARLRHRPVHRAAVRDVWPWNRGSLYPALERLQKTGGVNLPLGRDPDRARARYYTITASGRRNLGQEISSFERVCWPSRRDCGRLIPCRCCTPSATAPGAAPSGGPAQPRRGDPVSSRAGSDAAGACRAGSVTARRRADAARRRFAT